MDDDKQLTSLFSDFNPELNPDGLFMSQLKKKMAAVEMIKQYAEAKRRRSRLAIGIAACVGFVTGAVFMICSPYLAAVLGALADEWVWVAKFVETYGDVTIWSVIATASVVASYSAYDITMAAAFRSRATV